MAAIACVASEKFLCVLIGRFYEFMVKTFLFFGRFVASGVEKVIL
jgi:hypothetical protein